MKKFGEYSMHLSSNEDSFSVKSRNIDSHKLAKLSKVGSKWEYIAIIKRGFLKFDFYRDGEKGRIPVLLRLYLMLYHLPSKEYTIEFHALNNNKRDWGIDYLRISNIAMIADRLLGKVKEKLHSFIG